MTAAWRRGAQGAAVATCAACICRAAKLEVLAISYPGAKIRRPHPVRFGPLVLPGWLAATAGAALAIALTGAR